MTIKDTFDRLADAIQSFGTVAVRDELEQLADDAKDEQPGAAAALTDWEGTEIARERAFAVIRNRLVRERATDAMRASHSAETLHLGVR